MKRTTMSDANPYNPSNGSSNKRSKPPAPPSSLLPGHVAFRLLCHASRIGGVIGKSGTIIKQLQQSTGAKIRVEEPPADSSDRVVTVIGPAAVNSTLTIQNGRNSYIGSIGNSYNSNGSFEDNDSFSSKEVIYEVSKAQEGLIRVFERIVEVAAETDGVEMVVVSCRLLVEANQVGSVIGKGGKVVEKIRKDTGCKIRVLVENLSACAGPHDEVVEIEGDVLSVKKGLVAVSRCLQDCTPTDKTRMTASRPQELIPRENISGPALGFVQEMHTSLEAISRESFLRPIEASLHESKLRPVEAISLETRRGPLEAVPMETLRRPLAVSQEALPNLRVDLLSQWNSILPNTPSSSISYSSGIQPLSLESDRLGSKVHQQDLTYKILCSNDKVGCVIGKGGTIIRALQSETGANITIGPTKAECDDRLITVTSSESPESLYSPAQKAVILIFSRLIEAGIEKGLSLSSSPVTARLVVASNQVGCLLGKGGAIVAEIRKVTGASIRVLGGDQVPKCASENDQVVQMFGEYSKVKDALHNVTCRLRDNLFSSSFNNTGSRSSSSVLSETVPFPRTRESGPLRMQSSGSLTHSHSRYSASSQGMDHPGFPHNLDHSLSPRLWTSQMVTGVSPVGTSEVNRGFAHRRGGLELGSGNKTAIVTNTTVEIVVPENVIGSVYGENGSNLSRLRQISGAKVIVHEPGLGSSDRIIVISGTPDETQAAQSLLQAFILTAPPSSSSLS